MPVAAPKRCSFLGCTALVTTGGRCDQHPFANRFADKRRGSRHERGYGSRWERLREQILLRDGGLCQVCLELGSVTVGNEVDHKIAKTDGGTDDPENLQCICGDCHAKKTAAEARRGRGV